MAFSTTSCGIVEVLAITRADFVNIVPNTVLETILSEADIKTEWLLARAVELSEFSPKLNGSSHGNHNKAVTLHNANKMAR
jgi:hypothetical protein